METIANKVVEPIRDMLDHLSVKNVFGEAASEDNTTVIPVAQTMYGFGYGFGEDSEDNGGGGGGGGGKTSPTGYIRINPDGVSYEPIEDETKIALAGMFTGIWAIFWITLTVRSVAKSLAKVRAAKAG